MEQLTAMKITGLTLTNFRNHKKPESYTFGDVSYISGHNGTGKTTIAHGIAYALYGVSYYGEQKIERLMNETATGTQAQLDFTDQNGRAHTLIRNRNGDKTALLLDTYTIRQTDIDRMFCDRDTFLSMFNPFYLIERLGEKGRGLILKHLKPVPPQTVLEQMPENFRQTLKGIDLTKASMDELLKSNREAIRETEKTLTFLEGNVQSVKETVRNAGHKLAELRREKEEIETKEKGLSEKRYKGIDLDDLAIQRNLLISKLSEPDDTGEAILELQRKIEQARQKTYQSQYAQPLAEKQAEIKAMSAQYKAMAERVKGLAAGTQCPACLMRITEANLAEVRSGMMAQIQNMAACGNELMGQYRELCELDAKSKAVFEQFRSDDMQKLTAQLAELEQKRNTQKQSNIHSRLGEIEDQQRYGNLSEAELLELHTLQADLTGIDAQIKAITDIADESRLQDMYAKQEANSKELVKYRNILTALTEFIGKRTELAVADIQMPNVQIKLFDVVRTTGEVVDVFRFTYKGRDYTTLSLSEKTLAGVEIAAMVRKITGLDCPICIDNTESIAAFNAVSMPSQSLLLRFVKGQPLTVQSVQCRSRNAPVRELKKAG